MIVSNKNEIHSVIRLVVCLSESPAMCIFNPQRQVALLERLQAQLKRERAESMVLEARVREEVTKDFSELFSEMQDDYK